MTDFAWAPGGIGECVVGYAVPDLRLCFTGCNGTRGAHPHLHENYAIHIPSIPGSNSELSCDRSAIPSLAKIRYR